MKLHNMKIGLLSTITYFIVSPLFAAAVIDPATEPASVAAPYALSNTDLESSGTKTAYRPWFENGSWQGDLVQYNITSLGVLSTSLDLTKTPPVDNGTGTNWSARKVFADTAIANSNFWTSGTDSRNIITSKTGTDQVPFRWASLVPHQATIGSEAILNYVRGDRSNETDATPAGTFRKRYSLLGDIVHSNPVYVGPPASSFTFAGYSAYKNNNIADGGQADRTPIVYVGANDGMLHAFNASNGKEVYAYVPSMVFGNLSKLTTDPYVHTYFVDGELSSGDLYDTVSASWRTLLVGGLGSGGKGLFALDVTHASLTNETTNSDANDKVLWEKTGNAFGYIHGKAQIALLNDDKWYVIQGNGYNSVDNVAKLLLIESNGTVSSIATDATTGNGLSSPALVDTNSDGKPDYAYAGDLKGNLWKFNLTTKTAALKLFAAGVDQPITSVPEIARHPNGGIIIYFGTGSLLSGPNTTSADTANVSQQTFYGLWDNDATTLIANNTTNILNQPLTEADYNAATKIRYSTNNTAIDWATKKGWKVPFPIAGERLVGDPQLRGGRLQFITTSFNADTQPVAWLMELNYLNGGASKVIFDLSADSIFDGVDTVNRPQEAGVDIGTGDIPIAIQYGSYGIYSQPTLARINYASDTIIVNGLLMPLTQPCSGSCSGGFIGGHMDVDTDSPFGGIKAQRDSSPNSGSNTDGHEHEYDKEHGVVYVDWFNLEPRRGLFSLNIASTETSLNPRLNRVTEVCDPDDFTSPNHCETGADPAQTAADKLFGGDDISLDKKFFIVLANADINTGGKITIGTKTWNVKDYQDMITKKILDKNNADVSSDATFVDNEGDSLVFTLRSILAAGGGTGTLRIDFDNRAIIEGKLLATLPQCHWGSLDPYNNYFNFFGFLYNTGNPLQPNYDAHITNAQENDVEGYRWRNGALTMQLVDATNYKLQPITDTAHAKNDATNPVGGTHVFNYTQTRFRDNGDNITANQQVNSGSIKESGLLFEGAIFNHWGKLYKRRTGQDPVCYGHNRYNVSVAIEQAGLTNGEYQALIAPFNGNAALQDAFKAALEAYEASPTSVNKAALATIIADNGLEEYMKLRTYIRSKIPAQHLLEWDKGIAGEGSAGTSTPAEVQEGRKSASQTGQNFRTGRRTWIDLTP